MTDTQQPGPTEARYRLSLPSTREWSPREIENLDYFRQQDERMAKLVALVALLERGLRHLGDNPARSLWLDHQAWRDEAHAAFAATGKEVTG